MWLEEERRPGKFFQLDNDESGSYIMSSKDLCVIDKLEENIKRLNNEILSYKVNGLTPVEHNDIIQEKYLILYKKIEKNAQKIDILYDSLNIAKNDDELLKLNIELEELKKQRIELREKKSILQSKKVKQKSLNKYQEIIKQIELLKKKTISYYKILKQNEESFRSIKSALVKALMSKKQPL